jgi:hypothetical protein
LSAFITALSHSGGSQSQFMLEMILRGEWEKPLRFVVLNADPGMEDSRTYRFVRDTRRRCQAAGIDYITAAGPNLWVDLVNSINNGATRIDNPPFWCKKPDGSRGRLAQKCTAYYKIAPMDRALRHYMSKKHGVSWNTKHIRPGLVEKWIGFAADEWHRCSESVQGYITLRFPLIERNIDRLAIEGRYLKDGIPKPPRSVCAACFANGLDYFREMYLDRPEDWEKAVDVDNAIEFWHERGITEYPVFVSASLIRLRDMPAINFGANDEDLSEHHCNSGVCFL